MIGFIRFFLAVFATVLSAVGDTDLAAQIHDALPSSPHRPQFWICTATHFLKGPSRGSEPFDLGTPVP